MTHPAQLDRAAVETMLREMLKDFILVFNYGLDDLHVCEDCGCWMTIEEKAPVGEATLCPYRAFGSPRFPNEKCYSDRIWRKAIDGKLDMQWTIDSIVARVHREDDP